MVFLVSKGREGLEAFVVFAVPYTELLAYWADNAAKPSIPSDRVREGSALQKKAQKVGLSRPTTPEQLFRDG